MTTRPYASGLSLMITRSHGGRIPGNVAVPETNIFPREATCRKDFVIA
ncbi:MULTISPECIES: hypothetical protein [Nonomuraea]|uniref:DUF397 domain-containing protein n=1 Tax=Nonomuraea salmonea TaxID=46181 RepID=A0ABV5P2E2_9ACTN